MLGHRKLSSSEHWRIGRRAVGWAFAGCLLGAGAGCALTWLLPAKYTSSVTLRVVTGDSNAAKLAPQLSADRIAELRQQILTPQTFEALAARFEVRPGSRKLPVEVQVAEISRSIALEPEERGITLSFTASDVNVARDGCAELSHLFAAVSLPLGEPAGDSLREGPSQQFLAKQIEEAKRHRDEQDAKLAEFKRTHAADLSAGTGDASGTQAVFAAYNRELLAADAALRTAQEKRAALTEALFAPRSPAPKAEKPEESSETVALEQELAAKQAQLVALQARYTADYPDVVKLKADIADLQRRIDDSKRAQAAAAASKPLPGADAAPADVAQIQAQIRALDAQIEEKTRDRDRLQQQIQAAQARLEAAPVIQIEYAELKSADDAARDAYDRWMGKQQELEKALSAEQAAQRAALVATGPPRVALTSPNRFAFTFVGALAGLALALLTVLVLEWRDKMLRTEMDIKHFLALPTLAVIPAAGETGGLGGGHRGGRGKKEENILANA